MARRHDDGEGLPAGGGAHPLEPSGEEMRRALAAAADRIAAFVESLPEQPASYPEGSPVVPRSGGWPEDPATLDEALSEVFDRLAPQAFNTTGPGFLAYVPGGGLFHAALADLVGETVNRFTTVWAAAPGLARLEADVVRWMCDMTGLPGGAGGFLSSGGSIATLSAVVAARCDRLPEDFLRGTIYVSEETHHAVGKAALLAGFPTERVRRVPVDDAFRIRLDALEVMLAEDRHRGLRPFLLVGNAGTTNCGAVDPLEALAEVAAEQRLWLHVDAAYGGFFLLTERGRARLDGIERADSVALDPHKGLFLPYGTGCLLVRELATLRRSHAVHADYMPAMQDSAERLDLCDVSPELSRAARGLRVWLPLRLLGVEPFRRALDEKLDLAAWAHRQLQEVAGVEIVAPPALSTLAFRLVRPGLDDAALDDLNRRLLAAINDRQRVLLTATRLAGRFVIRICVLSFRTHLDRLRMCLEDIRAAVTEVGSGSGDAVREP